MSDRWAVLVALGAAAGAVLARPVPRWIGIVVVVVALVARRPPLLVIGVVALTSSLAAASWAGLVPPPPGPVAAVITLAGDPAEVGGAVRAIGHLGSKRVELSARGAAGAVLSQRLAGEQVRVTGKLAPLSPSVRPMLARRHVAAEVMATEVAFVGSGNLASRAANRLRRVLVRGAASMPTDQRTLFTGFVLGDDRGQSVETVDDFRSSGLSHLLVVSGGNVAFVLALAGPMLRRFGLGWRLLAGLGVLAFFGVLTRWEPSVLRASGMAGIALAAQAIGRPVSTLRLLALAVAGILVIDPLLVGSIGFLLSVGACAGIALLAQPIADHIPGPRPIASALAATIAAQAGVAPVLVPAFGAMPLATLPANLLALPAAGPVMTWGVLAGVPAGLVGGPVASALHIPTRLLVGWVALVARAAASAPLGRVGLPVLAAVTVLIVGAVKVRTLRWPAAGGAAALLLAPSLPLVLGRPPPMEGTAVMEGARVWRADGVTVVVIDRPSPGRLLGALRMASVRRIDLLVAERGGRRAADAVDPLQRRIAVARILALARLPGITGSTVVEPGTTAVAGPFVVTVTDDDPAVHVARAPPQTHH